MSENIKKKYRLSEYDKLFYLLHFHGVLFMFLLNSLLFHTVKITLVILYRVKITACEVHQIWRLIFLIDRNTK